MEERQEIGSKENPAPEKTAIYTPERSPESTGQLSGGEWQQLHSSNKPIEDKE